MLNAKHILMLNYVIKNPKFMLTDLQTLHLQLNSFQRTGEEAETGHRVSSFHQIAIDFL